MKFLEKYNINNKKLYETALTHTSYQNEHNLNESYERLEFLGDAVLDLVISDYLYNKYNKQEGVMTKFRAAYVCEKALCEYAKAIKLNEYIKVGKGEETNTKEIKPVILADCFESIIGALYIDKGYDLAKKFIFEIVIPYIENNSSFFVDYKSQLQEIVQSLQRNVTYELINESGPAHNKSFEYTVAIDGFCYGRAISNSKKDAQALAAKDALSKHLSNEKIENN
ncbi:MAG: ribonuclease III [Bacilli bacterium]